MTNLETIRRTRGLQQQDVADEAKVPQATISRAESGKGITLRSALKVARSLGLTVEEVFGDINLEPEPDPDTLPAAASEPSPAVTRPSHAGVV